MELTLTFMFSELLQLILKIVLKSLQNIMEDWYLREICKDQSEESMYKTIILVNKVWQLLCRDQTV